MSYDNLANTIAFVFFVCLLIVLSAPYWIYGNKYHVI